MNNQNGKGSSLRKGADLMAYYNNYDSIFRRPTVGERVDSWKKEFKSKLEDFPDKKQTVDEWAEHFGDMIKSYDGFRDICVDDRITEERYKQGLTLCTREFRVKP